MYLKYILLMEERKAEMKCRRFSSIILDLQALFKQWKNPKLTVFNVSIQKTHLRMRMQIMLD